MSSSVIRWWKRWRRDRRDTAEVGRLRSEAETAYEAGQLVQAEAAYRRLVQARPEDGSAWCALGQVLHDGGQLALAQQALERGLGLDPSRPAAHHRLGAILLDRSQVFEAAAAFQRALALHPERSDTWFALGRCLARAGQSDDALAAYDRALELDPGHVPAAWARALWLPPIHESEAAIDEARARFTAGLESISQSLSLHTPADIEGAVAAATSVTNFFLHYQGRNDLTLQARFGALLHRVAAARFPALASRRDGMGEAGGRLRVGFVSAHFRFHSVMKTHGRWVTGLDRSRFEVHAFHVTGMTDDTGTTDAIRRCADSYTCTTRPDLLVEAIAARNLDALVYLDLGMDPRCYLPAALRLAPVQCLAGGHPVTSGLPTMDYFLSSELMEPPDGDRHYTERLVRLPRLGGSHPRAPALPLDDEPARDRPVLLCSQSLFKLQPTYDDVFAEIAKRVGPCELWFLEGPMRPVAEVFERRLLAAFSRHGLDAAEYCRIHPPQSYVEFLALNRRADVFLDGIGWSGHNTALEAVACGLPIVTLPGDTMRSRHCLGILRRMGIVETIAHDVEQYVAIATRLATDPEYRERQRRAVVDGGDLVFDDDSPIRALGDFLESVCRGLRSRDAEPSPARGSALASGEGRAWTPR